MKAVNQFHDHAMIKQFTTGDFSTVSGDDIKPVDELEPWMQDEVDRIKNFFELLIELASSRAWSQMMFVSCFPYGLAAVLHEDRKVADQMLSHQKAGFQAILRAEDVVINGHEKVTPINKAELVNRLSDISFQNFQLSRELYQFCEQCDWDSQHPELRQMMRLLFGGPCETKYNLEDLFAHLASASKMSSQATAMNKSLTWHF